MEGIIKKLINDTLNINEDNLLEKVNKETLYENNELINEIDTKIRIIHFNDVYNIDARKGQEPCGGASRFINLLNKLKNKENDRKTIVVFSGDAFSPSTLSNLFKGEQMCDILNKCSINVACLGNHEFDFGIDRLNELLQKTNFQWLLSNVKDSETNDTLCNSLVYHIEQTDNIKIGIIGLVEQDWIDTLGALDTDQLKYESFLIQGNRLALELREKHSCNLIIALTHMRLSNDLLLVNKLKNINLVLGGHDHDYYYEHVPQNNNFLIKSGCDFRELTVIDLEGIKVSKIVKYTIDSNVNEDEEINEIINKYNSELDKQLGIPLGEINVDLDGRFSKIRSEETNLGNFICDIVINRVHADCCLLNSGSFRSDTLHSKGIFKLKDLKSILPYEDGLLVIELTGKQIYEALENGVSEYPNLEGRFPQLSGIKFKYDPLKPKYERVLKDTILIKNELLDFNKTYKLCTKKYLIDGKDGYLSLMNNKIIIDDEEIPPLITLVQDHFDIINSLNKQEVEEDKYRLRASIVPLFLIDQLLLKLSANKTDNNNRNEEEEDDKNNRITFKMASLIILKTLKLHKKVLVSKSIRRSIKSTKEYQDELKQLENEFKQLAPKIDGRITRITEDNEIHAFSS